MKESTIEVMNCLLELSKTRSDNNYRRSEIFDCFRKNGKITGINIDDAIVELNRLGYISLPTAGNELIYITKEGYRFHIDSVDTSRVNNVTIHGDVSQSAIAVDSSKSTLKIDGSVFLENLIQEIQEHPNLDQSEKKELLAQFQGWSKDPRLLTIVGSVLSSIL